LNEVKPGISGQVQHFPGFTSFNPGYLLLRSINAIAAVMRNTG